MQIQSGSNSFSVWAAGKSSSSAIASSLKRMSSGSILNSDNPAGTAISDRMEAMLEAMDSSSQNTQNSISMLQTGSSYMQSISSGLTRMKDLAIQSQGINSGADQENIDTEFKSIQKQIIDTASGYTASASFNGNPLLQGESYEVQTGPDQGQTTQVGTPNMAVQNDSRIGTVDTYTYNSEYQLVGSLHTDIQWSDVINDVSGISASSSDAVGAIDKAIDFVSSSIASNAAETSALQDSYESSLSAESDIMEAKSKISDVDMAKESTNFSKELIKSQVNNAMISQANSLPGLVVLSLLKN